MFTALGVLGLAARLVPSAQGLGTHVQLGLAPCAMWAATGLPCPACGLTTSFAHMAHLQPLLALRAHPVGALGYLAVCVAVPLSLVGLAVGVPPRQVARAVRLRGLLLLASIATALWWSMRVTWLLLA